MMGLGYFPDTVYPKRSGGRVVGYVTEGYLGEDYTIDQ